MNFRLDFETGCLSGEKPLEVFENLTPNQLRKLYQKIKNSSQILVGFLGYEWGAALEGVGPAHADDELKLPGSWFGVYENIIGSPSPFPLPSRERVRVRGFQSSFTKASYLHAIQKILNYLRAGDS